MCIRDQAVARASSATTSSLRSLEEASSYAPSPSGRGLGDMPLGPSLLTCQNGRSTEEGTYEPQLEACHGLANQGEVLRSMQLRIRVPMQHEWLPHSRIL